MIIILRQVNLSNSCFLLNSFMINNYLPFVWTCCSYAWTGMAI